MRNIWIILCLFPVLCFAQQPIESVAPSGSSMERFSPLGSPLESIIGDPNGEWAAGKADRELSRFDVRIGSDRLSVTRNLTQRRVEASGTPFGTGVREDLVEGLSASPSSGLSISMMRSRTETIDLGGRSLGASEVENLGLTQDYGRGSSSGHMSFSRIRTDTFDSRSSLTQTAREMSLGVSQGFSGGKVDYSRRMTSVQRPNLQPDIQNMETIGISSEAGRFGLTANLDRSSGGSPDQPSMLRRALTLSRQVDGVTVGVNYENISRMSPGVVEESTSQSFMIPFMVSGNPTVASFSSSTVQRNGLVMSDDRRGSLMTRLGGNDISGTWVRTIANVGGVENVTRDMNLSLPISFRGDKISLTHSRTEVMIGNSTSSENRLSSLTIPLGSIVRGSSFTHEIRGVQEVGKAPIETRTSNLVLPLTIGGHDVSTSIQRITRRTNGARGEQIVARSSSTLGLFGRNIRTEGEFGTTDENGVGSSHLLASASGTLRMLGEDVVTESEFGMTSRDAGGRTTVSRTHLVVPFRPGPVVIERRTTRDEAATGSTSSSEVVNISSPRVTLGSRVSIQADAMMTDQAAGLDQRFSHVNVAGTPLHGMTMTADVVRSEVGVGTLTVDTAYALSDRLSMTARYLERERADASPLVNRLVMFQRRGGLDLRAGAISVDDGVNSQPVRSLVEVGVGDARRARVDLRYQDYDEEKLVGLSEPTMSVQVAHGSPGSMQMRFGFEDQADRVGPSRQYGVMIPIGGSSLDLGLSQNMVDPRDPTATNIRVASVYDAKYGTRVFGDISMDLGYRLCATEESDPSSWYQVRMSGGRAEGGGALQLGYASGDFVTLDANPDRTPTSTLSLRYDRRKGDGTLSLVMNRSTVPVGQGTDSLEARLQLERRL